MSGEQRKAVIKNADMDEKMQQDAVDIASRALAEYNIEKVCRHRRRPFGTVREHALASLLTIRTFNLTSGSWYLQDVAAYIKKEFDRKYSPTWYASCVFLQLARRPPWLPLPIYLASPLRHRLCSSRHVVVGRNFGSYVTHETKHFIYFYLGQVAVLLFKSG
jgi:dynein light chain LC8-type